MTPSESAKNRVKVSLMRGDLESRGHKIPPRTPSKFVARHPTMRVGSGQWPTFVVFRGEDMLAGRLSITQLCLAVDAETAAQVLDYVEDRESGHLPAPDFAREAST